MPVTGFYAENLHRDWPFLTRTRPLTAVEGSSSDFPVVQLPQEAIVDFVAIMDIDSGYSDADGHYVYLNEISRAGDTFSYEFRTTAEPAATESCIFTRAIGTAEFAGEWVDSELLAEANSSESVAGCSTEPKWRAFMASGRFTELADMLADGDVLTFPSGFWRIEPSRMQSLLRSYLRTLTLANSPRQLATPPDECNSDGAIARTSPYVVAGCLSGNISFQEGYNCSIRQESRTGAIVIGAGKGAGDGEPCGEVSTHAGEQPPAGSRFLTGGPGCGDVLKSINGVGGRNLTIVAGNGFSVTADSDNPHTIIIDRTLRGFVTCPDGSEISSEGVG